MRIGQAAKASGIPAKMIRYYENIGLVPAAERLESGYRDYDATDVHRLRFIRAARHLGYSHKRVRELLSLWSDRNRSSSQAKAMASAHVAELETRATELADMIKPLRRLYAVTKGRAAQRRSLHSEHLRLAVRNLVDDKGFSLLAGHAR
jgi:Cu(I)-responsive transcriptional regulator